MALLTKITILLVLACICYQMILGSCQKSHGRRERGDRGQHRKISVQKVGYTIKPVSEFRVMERFVTKDMSVCTWAARGENLVILNVTCKKGDLSFSCEYDARPSLCPQYTSHQAGYWAQISKAVKKHKNLCQANSGLLRAGMCKGAARDAHFRLRVASTEKKTTPKLDKAVKSCQSDNRKLAEEFCSDSWSSFCTFFFTMVKDSDC